MASATAPDRWTAAVDDGFDSARRNQDAAIEAVEAAMETGVDAYDEMADSYLEPYAGGVESMLGVTAAAEEEATRVTVPHE